MRLAGRAAAEILLEVGPHVAPGVTTDRLDEIVHEATIARGGYPSPLNYRGYPKSVCTSVNEVICHGIPDSRALADGDIVNIDVTIFLDGVHGDTSVTFPVGEVSDHDRHLIAVRCEAAAVGQNNPDVIGSCGDVVSLWNRSSGVQARGWRRFDSLHPFMFSTLKGD